MMKRIIILMLALMLIPSFSIAQSGTKKRSKKEVSPFVEGKQKVRKADYDSVWKFTSFDAKKIYYCNFDYSQLPKLLDERHPEWGNFTPVMNYLTTISRSPMRICALFAINPTIDDATQRDALIEQARNEALENMKMLTEWMSDEDMKNKVQINVAQIDNRYWQGPDYFVTEQPKDEIIHVGVLMFFGTKKLNMFPSAADSAQKFNDVKFFPNDATVQPSYDSYLDQLATYLLQNERLEVMFRGYSDNVGTDAYNIGLSRQRAVELKKKLVARNVPEYRIEIEAKGSADPIGDNNTYEGRIANNRVAVILQ